MAAPTGAAPHDSALADSGAFLYIRDATAGEVRGFAVHANGSLSPVASAGGLPASAEGLAAFGPRLELRSNRFGLFTRLPD
jgi:hypothetical protein